MDEKCREAVNERYWQNWDRGDAAKLIDHYWLEGESVWRHILVEDIASQFMRKEPMLEVGCGSGLIYREMIRRGIVTPHLYTGGDVSKKMLAIARQRFPEARFIDLDALDLKQLPRSQRNVICVHVLQHLPDYRRAISEMMSVTDRKLYVVSWFTKKPEDEIVFSEPSEKWDGQSFHNNYYSLSKFTSFVLANSGRDIEELRIRNLGGPNYSISITFIEPSSVTVTSIVGKSPIDTLRALLKRLVNKLNIPK